MELKTKPVSQLDPDGYFAWITEADESPMRPDTFILPGGCVDALPPEIPEGFRARWNGDGFELVAIPTPEPEPQPTHQEMVAGVILRMKTERMNLFRVLDTIQVDALTTGNQQAAQAILQAKAALTSLNSIDLSGYATVEQMEAAIQQAYFAVVAQAPQAVQDAFRALVPR